MAKKEMPEIMPIGSVVRLKKGQKKIMIAGRFQKDRATGTVYDYCAVLWPEGFIRSDRMYLFNHEDIDRVYFVGLQDEEEFRYRFELEKKWEELSGSLLS